MKAFPAQTVLTWASLPERISTFASASSANSDANLLAPRYSTVLRSPPESSYSIAIICNPGVELNAILRALDERYYSHFSAVQLINNVTYKFGRIGHWRIVIVAMARTMNRGSSKTSDTLSQMFPHIEYYLLVGVAGNLSTPQDNLRLGDVIIGMEDTQTKIVQHDTETAASSPDRAHTFAPDAIRHAISALDKGKVEGASKITRPPPPSDSRVKENFRKLLSRTEAEHRLSVRWNRRRREKSQLHYHQLTSQLESSRQGHEAKLSRTLKGMVVPASDSANDTKQREDSASDWDILEFDADKLGVMHNAPRQSFVIRGVQEHTRHRGNKFRARHAAKAAAGYARNLLLALGTIGSEKMFHPVLYPHLRNIILQSESSSAGSTASRMLPEWRKLANQLTDLMAVILYDVLMKNASMRLLPIDFEWRDLVRCFMLQIQHEPTMHKTISVNAGDQNETAAWKSLFADSDLTNTINDRLEQKINIPPPQKTTTLPNSQNPKSVKKLLCDKNHATGRIKSTKAFKWLMSRVQVSRECITFGRPTIAQIVRSAIAERCASDFGEADNRSEGLTVGFLLEWNPQAFVKEQQYEGPGEEAILNAITLTGTWDRALATTTSSYLNQIWPMTSQRTLTVLKALVGSGKGEERSKESDSIHPTYIKARIDGSQTRLELHGDAVFITEIAAQFCWLASALRSDPKGAMATSSLRMMPMEDKPSASIRYTFQLEPKPSNLPDKGTCWHPFFRNAVIVKGSPIPRRANDDSIGLEISLPMMTALIGSQILTDFGGIPCIKGFAGILIPTRKIGTTLVWHLIADTQRSYVSYADPRAREIRRGIRDKHVRVGSESLLADIEHHVVGWCSQASLLAGSLKAKKDIGHSHLAVTPGKIRLDRVTIGGGKFVTAAVSLAIGTKDCGISIESKRLYVERLYHISQKLVILYDVAEEKGWLVNGASAVLHLTLASWEFGSKGLMGGYYRNKTHHLKECSPAHPATSAFHTMTNEQNQNLLLFANSQDARQSATADGTGPETELPSNDNKDQQVRFSDRVQELLHYMEQAQAAADQTKALPGIELSFPSQTVDGFDFTEIARLNNNVKQRRLPLPLTCRSWPRLARTAGAIVLFGNHFGDLITPHSSGATCGFWTSLPSHRHVSPRASMI